MRIKLRDTRAPPVLFRMVRQAPRLPSAHAMRLLVAVLGLSLLAGCVESLAVTRRVALSPNPGTPPAIRGTSGLGLAGRTVLMGPRAGPVGGGLAVPTFQPEVNGVFRFGDRFFASVDVIAVPHWYTQTARTDVPAPGAETGYGGLLGFGYDQPIAQGFGVHGSLETGQVVVQLTTATGGRAATRPVPLPIARAALAPYLERGPLRLYAAGSVGTDVFSDPLSVTSSISGDLGRTDIRAVGLVGAGARYQAHPNFSAGLELWVPVSIAGVQHGPQLSFNLQVANFDFFRGPEPDPAQAPL